MDNVPEENQFKNYLVNLVIQALDLQKTINSIIWLEKATQERNPNLYKYMTAFCSFTQEVWECLRGELKREDESNKKYYKDLNQLDDSYKIEKWNLNDYNQLKKLFHIYERALRLLLELIATFGYTRG